MKPLESDPAQQQVGDAVSLTLDIPMTGGFPEKSLTEYLITNCTPVPFFFILFLFF